MKKRWKVLIISSIIIVVLSLSGFVGLCIYASDYRTLDEECYYIFEEEDVYLIEGGNHAQFGNYGPNDGDGVASINAEEQQDEAVALIVEFMTSHESE